MKTSVHRPTMRVALCCACLFILTQSALAQTARVQFINAIVDEEVTAVDVYMDNVLLVDDLAYKTATSFLEIPPDEAHAIAVVNHGGSLDSPLHSYEMPAYSADSWRYAVLAGGADASACTAASGDPGSVKAYVMGARANVTTPGNFEQTIFQAAPEIAPFNWQVYDSTGAYYATPWTSVTFGSAGMYVGTTPQVFNGKAQRTGSPWGYAFASPGDFRGMENKVILGVLTGWVEAPVGRPDLGLTWANFLSDGSVSEAGVTKDGSLDACLASIHTNVERQQPDAFRLVGNYPNPFNPSTTIQFDLATAAEARLVILDVLGRPVAVVVEGYRAAGQHEITWVAGEQLPSGVYLARLETAGKVDTRPMVLMR